VADDNETVTLTINGREIAARQGELVIAVAEANGIFIPRFCYHPRMHSVGMCRMCIVDIDTGRGPTLQPACMIEVAQDMKVDTESATTKKAQDGVLEYLLINHPLDCPVCDKGGECPLQDNTYAYGPGESRFVEEKRHYEKPIPISSLVDLDRERCILCDRCTRFARHVAGDAFIAFINRGSQTEVNTFPGHPFASYFSGNTVQICPVGALLARPYRFKARPWDLTKVESTCTTCAVGCRVTVEQSRNHVLRYQGVDIDPVNWGWLCDKGRFGFEAIESEDRLSEPLIRKPSGNEGDGELIAASWAEALGTVASAVKAAEPSAVAFLGGARLTNEAAYAWAKLAKGVIGTDNVDAQLGDGLPADVVVSLPQATIDDVCTAGGTVVVASGDLREELPVLFLRLRDAVVNRGVKVIELAATSTGIGSIAAVSLRHRPGEVNQAMRALVGGGDATAILDGDLDAAKALIGEAPLSAIVGRSSVAESDASIVDAASVLLDAHPTTKFLVALRRANVRGALDLGLAPGLLPGRVSLDEGREWFAGAWPRLPEAAGLDARGILEAAADGRIEVLFLLGADPLADFPDQHLAERALAGARTVVAVDIFRNSSAAHADVVLAAAGYAEVDGTTTNIEGRVSRLAQQVTPPGTSRPDWMLAAELAFRLGSDLGVDSVEAIWDEIERLSPAHAGITRALLDSPAGSDGILAPLRPEVAAAVEGTPVEINGAAEQGSDAQGVDAAEEDAAADGEAAGDGRPAMLTWAPRPAWTAPAVDAYSLRLVTARKLYDHGTLVQHSPSLAALSPGGRLLVNPYDLDRLGVADGGAVNVTSARASTHLEAHASTAVPRGAAALVWGQEDARPNVLIDARAPVTEIRVETP